MQFACAFRSELSLQEIVQRMHAQLDPSPQLLLIQWRRILQMAMRAVRQPGFSYGRLTSVQFSGEDADDERGPRREFFT